jgi:hypothetical protein
MGGACSTNGGEEERVKLLVGKPEGRKPLGRPRRRWVDLVEVECYHLGQNLPSSRLLSKNLKIRIYNTIILTVVLYGCETWSLTLNEELGVFENRVLRRIFGPKRDEATGGRRKLHNEELHDLYS